MPLHIRNPGAENFVPWGRMISSDTLELVGFFGIGHQQKNFDMQ